MATSRKPMTKKLMIMGIDGMDPRFTRKMLDKGRMPNTKKIIDQGSSAQGLVLLGAQPTITPPMWTTLATGAYPSTHGITCYLRQSKTSLTAHAYNFDSRNCEAEQLWNVTAEAGMKTLVWHWPGSSWPPSSDSPNLMVVDGTQPGTVNMGVGTVDKEKVLVADVKTEKVLFVPKAASDSHFPCVIDDLEVEDKLDLVTDAFNEDYRLRTSDTEYIVMAAADSGETSISDTPFDVTFSPITGAKNWEFDIPEDSKEFIMLHSGGLIRRPCLIVKDDKGTYDKVRIYKNKKSNELVVELEKDVFTPDVIDEAIKHDKTYTANRDMRVLELSEDGTHLRMWISDAIDAYNDSVFSPASLLAEIRENVGAPRPISLPGGADVRLMRDCMTAAWDANGEWVANTLHYLIDAHDLDVVFSHFHCVDLQSHMIARYLKTGHNDVTPEQYQELYEGVYDQTDRYIGRYLDLLDKGWTVIVLSDHGLVCPEYAPDLICDPTGCNAGVMGELGFTVMKKDENGDPIREVDWTKTKAIQNRGNHIYINLKGRDKHELPDGTVLDGIVDPADKWQVEEEIITVLYGYHDKQTGQRIIQMALRNKDALLLGLSGPESGDIVIWTADGYNYDHGDSLSTCYGFDDTSTSPIFFGAGPGIKKGFTTDRVIREVDVAPTVAALLGVRMPAQCEGAPAYQIFTEEF